MGNLKKLKKKNNEKELMEKANRFFDSILIKAETEKETSQKGIIEIINDELNLFTDSLHKRHSIPLIRDFDQSVDLSNENDLIAVVREKIVYITCMMSARDFSEYAKMSSEKQLDFQLKINLVRFLYGYQMEHYGAEILASYGYEMAGRTENGGAILIDKGNLTEKQRRKRETIRDVKMIPITEGNDKIN